MDEKKCKHCAMSIPKDARICPHCRKKQRGPLTPVLFLIAFLMLVNWLFSGFAPEGKNPPPATTASTGPILPTAAVIPEPVLELQGWNWREEYDYFIAEGTVKNVSAASINNVQAVIQIYDAREEFIKSASSLIEYRPILPGQISPFKVMASHNPKMAKARIDFKSFSGGTLYWKAKEKKKK